VKFVMIAMLLLSKVAMSQGLPDFEEMKGANWFCSNDGVMYAFDVKNKKVWQSDKGEEDGIRLKVEKGAWHQGKCMVSTCFSVSASIALGSSEANYEFVVDDRDNATVEVVIDGQPMETLELKCSAKN